MVIPRENPIFLTFSHSLGFHKENIRYLGYSSGKSGFPDIFAFWTDFVLFLLLLSLMFLLLLVLLLLLLLLSL